MSNQNSEVRAVELVLFGFLHIKKKTCLLKNRNRMMFDLTSSFFPHLFLVFIPWMYVNQSWSKGRVSSLIFLFLSKLKQSAKANQIGKHQYMWSVRYDHITMALKRAVNSHTTKGKIIYCKTKSIWVTVSRTSTTTSPTNQNTPWRILCVGGGSDTSMSRQSHNRKQLLNCSRGN